jgi:hypothetical protein
MPHRKSTTSTCALIIILDGDLVQSPEHLGVAYLAAVLRQRGHECSILEIVPGKDADSVERVRALEPRFVGISLTTVNLPRAQRLGAELRQSLGPEVHICAGGPIATFLGERLFEVAGWSFLDSLVRGEGEKAIVSLVEKLLAGEPIHDVPVVTLPGHQPALPMVVAVDDLNSLPWPARDQLERQVGAGRRLPYVRVSTSRGCTARCTFCNAPHAGNNLARRKGWRGRDPEDVVDELQYLQDRYNVDTFDFIDSTFEDPGGKAAGKERVRRIADLILERGLGIYYNTCSQACNWHEEDRELLRLLYRSGLEKVLIGIESGSDRVLAMFKKKSRLEDNHRAIRLFREQGVYVAFGFIMFHPHSEWQDVEDNADFLARQLGHNLRRFITRLELYPGAEIIHQLEADGLLADDYWQTLNPYAYKYANPEIGRMAEMLNRLFGNDYLSRGTIVAEPSVFAFETYDITLHTYVSRLRRRYLDDPHVRELIEDHSHMIDAQMRELAAFNADLFAQIMDLARSGRGAGADLAANVEDRFAQAMEHLKSIQMRLGMHLRRSGVLPQISRIAA